MSLHNLELGIRQRLASVGDDDRMISRFDLQSTEHAAFTPVHVSLCSSDGDVDMLDLLSPTALSDPPAFDDGQCRDSKTSPDLPLYTPWSNTSFSDAWHVGGGIYELSQVPYTKGSNKRRATQLCPVVIYNNYLLVKALRREYGDLHDHGDFAFPSLELNQKMSYRYHFVEYFKYSRQVNVLRAKGADRYQPTKGFLATLAAREMQTYIDFCGNRDKPFPYKLNELVLLSIDLVSDGSLQPKIGVLQTPQ